MGLKSERKAEIIGEYKKHDGDTGSAQVQIAMLSTRIRELTEHLKVHKKDHASRRGLLKMVGRRSTLLNYVQRRDPQKHDDLAKRLRIRR